MTKLQCSGLYKSLMTLSDLAFTNGHIKTESISRNSRHSLCPSRESSIELLGFMDVCFTDALIYYKCFCVD